MCFWGRCVASVTLYMVFLLPCLASAEVTLLHGQKEFSDSLRKGSADTVNYRVALMLLDNIDANVMFLPLKRMTSTLERSINAPDTAVCALFRIKNKARAQVFDYSLPLAFGPSYRLFMQNELASMPESLLNEEGQIISLQQVMAHYSASQLVLTEGRSYGEFLDGQISKLNPRQIARVHTNSIDYLNARMFTQKRADFSILFPREIEESKIKRRSSDYNSYLIVNTPAVITSHIACNPSDKSKAFLRRVNTYLLTLYQTPEFLAAHLDYLPAEEHQVIKDAIKLSMGN